MDKPTGKRIVTGLFKKEVTEAYKQWCIASPEEQGRRWQIDRVYVSEYDAVMAGDKLIMRGVFHKVLPIVDMLAEIRGQGKQNKSDRLKQMKTKRGKYNGE